MTVSVVPTDVDFEAACSRRFADGPAAWAALKREAKQAAAQRLLAFNAGWRERVVKAQEKATGQHFLDLQEEFDQAMAQHDQLMAVAYPSSAEAARG